MEQPKVYIHLAIQHITAAMCSLKGYNLTRQEADTLAEYTKELQYIIKLASMDT